MNHLVLAIWSRFRRVVLSKACFDGNGTVGPFGFEFDFDTFGIKRSFNVKREPANE